MGFDLMYYNARWYDPGITQFTSPDTIIPNLYNSADWNRYGYARYNPLKYTDPSGHCAIEDDEEDCHREHTTYVRHTPSAEPPSQLQTPQVNPACSGTNWSIVCKDPTLISKGQVQTPVVYPTYQIPDTYDGPYADEDCYGWWCAILLLADLGSGIQYQSNIPAYIGESYVYANINYEVHSGQYGNYSIVTGLEISNSTDAMLSFDSVSITDKSYLLEPSILIEPNQKLIIQATFRSEPSLYLNFSSNMYNAISLLANFP